MNTAEPTISNALRNALRTPFVTVPPFPSLPFPSLPNYQEHAWLGYVGTGSTRVDPPVDMWITRRMNVIGLSRAAKTRILRYVDEQEPDDG